MVHNVNRVSEGFIAIFLMGILYLFKKVAPGLWFFRSVLAGATKKLPSAVKKMTGVACYWGIFLKTTLER